MKECSLQQRALADVLGVTLDRVKSLTSGKVQKLTREESEALIRKLHIRGDWLATGEGPMLQSEGERQAQAALDRVGNAAQTAARLGLPAAEGTRLMELLYYVESGNGDGVRRILADLAGLGSDEAVLINSYRRCSEPARANVLQNAMLLAAGAEPAAAPAAKAPRYTVDQKFNAPVGQQINGDIVNGQVTGNVVANKGKGKR